MSNLGSFEACEKCLCRTCVFRHVNCSPCIECNGKPLDYNLKYNSDLYYGVQATSPFLKISDCKLLENNLKGDSHGK